MTIGLYVYMWVKSGYIYNSPNNNYDKYYLMIQNMESDFRRHNLRPYKSDSDV